MRQILQQNQICQGQMKMELYFRAVGLYKAVIRPFLFRIDPEKVHYKVFRWLHLIFRFPGARNICRSLYVVDDPNLHRRVFDIEFPNPVGLAAGFDKDAKLFNDLSDLGFGFIEVGTVTPLAQPGNDQPRMFRLPKDEALINRMGFNNDGMLTMAERLKKRRKNIIIGGNIGKNKDTPNEHAHTDFEKCFRQLFNVVDYFAVNVSSPNTPGLRTLQDKEPLLRLLMRLQEVNKELSTIHAARRPILLKIAPDLNNDQLDEIIEVVISSKVDGIIATNTTVSREGLVTSEQEIAHAGVGGLSGKPLKQRSTEVIRYLAHKSQGKFKIIGVGGIHSANDAMEKLNAGASLIQLYTGFIYEGPALISEINKRLLREIAGQHQKIDSNISQHG